MSSEEIVLADAHKGERLDRAVHEALLAAKHEVSMREVRAALVDGRILIDGKTRAPGLRALGGERVDVSSFIARVEAIIQPEPALLLTCDILYDDARRLCLAKPGNVPSQPLRPDERGTMLGAAIAHTASIATAGPPLEGGLTHRLDIQTSGALLFAKDMATRLMLRRAFASGAIEKRYQALVWDPENRLRAGRKIDAWIGRGPDASKVATRPPNTRDAQSALTEILSIERLRDSWRLVDLLARSGRRHQVRVHLASIGTPIAGDTVYGGPTHPSLDRLALHASRLVLPDRLTIEAPLAMDLYQLCEQLS